MTDRPAPGRLPAVLLLLATLATAAAYLRATLALPYPELADPLGPQIFPILVSSGLFLCALLMVVDLRRRRDGSGPVLLEGNATFDLRSSLTVAGIAVWTALYFFAFERAGFLLSTVVFLFGLMCVFHAGHRLTNLCTAAGFTLGAWLLFTRVLSVRLPQGILPF
ncbi:MAG: tripartite tricarboxylate transporter TctB family protein [Rhodocyclaceae bacterium]|nr:tripartite tricarboxylate transporter TctB family protein [Rhodocyclaceae bacterium]